MIHSIFGSNRPLVLSLLIIPAVAYGILAYNMTPIPTHPFGGPLFDWVYTALPSPVLLIVSGLFVNLIGAYLVNLLYNSHDFSERENYFPALFYFLLASLQLSWVYLNPVLIGNVFVLLALRRILRMYRVQEITSMIYDAGFFLALGSLFFPLLILTFPLLWLSLIQLRTFNFREWLVPIIGVLTPTAFAGLLFYWFDYTIDISEFIAFTGLPHTEVFTSHGFWYLPVLILSVFVLAIGVLAFLSGMNTSTVHQKNTKKVFITTSILMLGLCLYGISLHDVQAGMFAALALPVSVFVGVYFAGARRKIINLILFYLWIVLLLFYPILAATT